MMPDAPLIDEIAKQLANDVSGVLYYEPDYLTQVADKIKQHLQPVFEAFRERERRLKMAADIWEQNSADMAEAQRLLVNELGEWDDVPALTEKICKAREGLISFCQELIEAYEAAEKNAIRLQATMDYSPHSTAGVDRQRQSDKDLRQEVNELYKRLTALRRGADVQATV